MEQELKHANFCSLLLVDKYQNSLLWANPVDEENKLVVNLLLNLWNEEVFGLTNDF